MSSTEIVRGITPQMRLERRSEKTSPNLFVPRMTIAHIPLAFHSADLARDFPDLNLNLDSSLYIHGVAGSGKTHLMCAFLKEHILSRFLPRQCFMITTDELLERIRATYRGDKQRADELEEPAEILLDSSRLRKYDILALDDLGAEKITDWTLGILSGIINYWYENMKQIVVTSNLSIKDLSKVFDQRIASRLTQMCKVVKTGSKDLRCS